MSEQTETSILSEIASNLASVEARINAACLKIGISRSEITLVAVSKKQAVQRVQAYLDLCEQKGELAVLGENYVQEFSSKKLLLKGRYDCHLIGGLQSNKHKQALDLFQAIETIDSQKLVRLLDAELSKRAVKLPVLVQVNISAETSKKGIDAYKVEDFILDSFKTSSFLQFSGLMTIPKFYDNPEDSRPDFQNLAKLKATLLSNSKILDLLAGRNFELSMGMSADFDIAIEEGATVVRVGSAIFGQRA
ncbi:MAG: YggS family pyridoxal phosphate-dependent enzyme [Bdellovibrionota bacterium]